MLQSSYFAKPKLEAPTQIAEGGRVQNVKELVPAHQLAVHRHLTTFKHIEYTTVPTNLFSNSSSQFRQDVDFQDVGKITRLDLEVGLTVATNPAVIVPTTEFFEKIVFRANGRSASESICTWVQDVLREQVLSSISKSQPSMYKLLNIDPSLGLAPALAPGTYKFIVPLPGVFDHLDVSFHDIKHRIQCEFTPASTIVASGSGTVTCTSLRLLAQSHDLSRADQAEYEKRHQAQPHSNYFLEPAPMDFYNEPITVNSTKRFDLTSLNGDCAGLIVCARDTGATNADNGHWKLLNFGDDAGATIDLVNSNNESQLGIQAGIPTRWLRNEIMIKDRANDWNAEKASYVLPFGDSIRAAFEGKRSGFHNFDGNRKQQLSISFPPARTDEVQTITLGAALDAGAYRFMFRGELSPSIAYNANTAAMKAAIESMKSIKSRNITVTASAAASAGASFTLTFVCPETTGLEGDLFNLIGGQASGAEVVVSSARTTAGTSGLAASGNYDIRVWALMYKKASYYKGKLNSTQETF